MINVPWVQVGIVVFVTILAALFLAGVLMWKYTYPS
jgi:hypothetical protein